MNEESNQTFEPPLDPRIEKFVRLLISQDIETFESCQGGPGHAYPEPTVRFYGGRSEGYRAVSYALQAGFRLTLAPAESAIGYVAQVLGTGMVLFALALDRLRLPLGPGAYLVAHGGSREVVNGHMMTLNPTVERFHAYRGQSYGST